MQQAGVKVAWYAIDEQDNDPIRFAAYLINAFRELTNSKRYSKSMSGSICRTQLRRS